MKISDQSILVLGANGLAGRTIVEGLIKRTPYRVVAAGRNPEKLTAVLPSEGRDRIELLISEATDQPALRRAFQQSALVINAIGPYAVHGAAIARLAVECGRPYVDCANEQVHYRRMRELDAEARRNGLLLATGAGAIPGVSTLLAARLLEDAPWAKAAEIIFAQFQHAYANSGLASMMSGVLDAGYRPVALSGGKDQPVRLGDSQKNVELPFPFGRLRLLEVPTIATPALSARFPLRELHTWFYLGEQPTWIFGLIRLLQPQKRPWAYRLIETIARPMNVKEQQRAVAAGFRREALLSVTVYGAGSTRTGTVLLRDGAAPMECLPVMIARECLSGRLNHAGLATPLDLLTFDRLRREAADVFLKVDFE